MKKINGYAKWILAGIAVAGIIWNAATLHNDVKHLTRKVEELQADVQAIKGVIFVPEWRNKNQEPKEKPKQVRE